MPNDIAVELAAKVGQTLPLAYLQFLDSLPARASKAPEGFGIILRYAPTNQEWHPYRRERLPEEVQYDKRGRSFPQALETAMIADRYSSEDDVENALELEARWKTEWGFTLKRLSKGFCIGDDGNGEPVFIDAQTGAIFVHYHDGADIEKWADSVEAFLDNSVDYDWNSES